MGNAETHPGPRPKVRDDLAELTGYHSPQVSVDIRLNTNEAPGPPPDGFAETVAAAAKELEWHRYPDRAATRLRSKLAEHHGVDPSQIFVANGSNEVLQTILLTYAGAGRKVLTFEPTYALHSHIARLSGAEAVAGEREPNFGLNAEKASSLVQAQHPAVTFLCSPNNPTGMVEERETVEAVLSAVTRIGGLLVVDEAYGQFAPWSALELLSDTPADAELPLVVSKTFSKTWAMAAARLGYAIAPSWLVDELNKVVLPYHLDALKQAAGVAALDFAAAMNERVASIVEERGRISAQLTHLGCEVWPSGSNFILFRPPADGDHVWQGLLDRSVLIRNTASWDRLAGCLRVTVGTNMENTSFLEALADTLDP